MWQGGGHACGTRKASRDLHHWLLDLELSGQPGDQQQGIGAEATVSIAAGRHPLAEEQGATEQGAQRQVVQNCCCASLPVSNDSCPALKRRPQMLDVLTMHAVHANPSMHSTPSGLKISFALSFALWHIQFELRKGCFSCSASVQGATLFTEHDSMHSVTPKLGRELLRGMQGGLSDWWANCSGVRVAGRQVLS